MHYTAILDGSPLRVDVRPVDRAEVLAAIRAARAQPTRYSLLKLMAQSPWDYLRAAVAALESADEESLAAKLGAGPGRDKGTALRFGTAIHHMILGSAERVVIYDRAAADAYAPPAPTPTKKRGRGVAALLEPAEPEPAPAKKVTRAGGAWEAFQREHLELGHVILLEREHLEARAMADMILRSPRACEWLFDGTIVEQRIDWRLRGRAIRSTPDARKPRKWVADLKSCQDSAPDRFVPQVYRLLYHAQLEFYCQAAEHADGRRPDSARIVAIDRKRPPRCYEVPPEGLELGARCIGAWIEQLLVCEHSESFPFDDHLIATPPEYLGDVEVFDVPDDDSAVEEGAFA